jgi:hypothetical protein
MESNGAPLWAQELRKFTEFSLGRIDERPRKLEHMDVRITAQLDALKTDGGQVRNGVDEIGVRLTVRRAIRRRRSARRPGTRRSVRRDEHRDGLNLCS